MVSSIPSLYTMLTVQAINRLGVGHVWCLKVPERTKDTSFSHSLSHGLRRPKDHQSETSFLVFTAGQAP